MSEDTSLTAEELAVLLGAKVAGDPQRVIRSVATLESATADDVSWVGSPGLMKRADASRAGVILIPDKCPVPAGKTAIAVADPDLAICTALERFAPPPDPVPAGVHPSAAVSNQAVVTGVAIGAHVSVGAGAIIGAGTQLHAGVYVGADAHIGRHCTLWPNVVVRERVRLGDRVVIHPNSTIGADGFGYLHRDGQHVKIPQIGSVIIEDDVEIGANCAVDRARSGVTRVGRGTKIDNLVQVAHNVEIGAHCILVGQAGMGGSTILGQGVVLAGQVGVIDHLRIGDGVQVAAKSVVMNDIPAGQVIRGIPAKSNQRFLREQASLRKLPDLLKQVRSLTRRIEQLEKDDSASQTQ